MVWRSKKEGWKMQRLPERISYLQGLGQGMNIQESGPQGRMIEEMLAVMADMAGAIGRLEEDMEEIRDYVESLDDGLCQLEDDIYGDEEEETEYIELRCQNCGEDVFFESDLLDDDDVIEIVCPRCHEVVFVSDGRETRAGYHGENAEQSPATGT